MAATSLYMAIMLELERRRIAVGISMEAMSELMGSAERSYSKMIWPDTPSGRLAQWQTLQLAIDTLYCDGFEIRIVPTKTGMLDAPGMKKKIKAEAATWDRRLRREIMADLGRKGNAAWQKKVSPERRSEIASKAAKARWDAVRNARKHVRCEGGIADAA